MARRITSTPDNSKTRHKNVVVKAYSPIVHQGNYDEEINSSKNLSDDAENDSNCSENENSSKDESDVQEKYSNYTKNNEITSHTRVRQTSTIFMIVIICSIIFVILAVIISYQKVETFPGVTNEKFSNQLYHLQSKYDSVKPIVFEEFESAVTLINTNGLPLSFVFAHRSNEKVGNMTLTLIKDFAKLASQYLGNGSELTISQDNFYAQDYGELLTRWRPDIEYSHTVVVPNLQLVPAHIAPVFHILCDEVTPYVRRTLYLHTVDLGENISMQHPQSNKAGPGYLTAVQKRLRESWPDMRDEVFDPLLSRIAGSVHILD